MEYTEVKAPRAHYVVRCTAADGTLRWEERMANLVTDEGVNKLLQELFKGANYTAAWYMGLLNNGAVLAATDTAGVHPGWTEFVDYSQVSRPALVLGAVGNKVVGNEASQALFTMSAAGTLAGVFLSTSAAKGLASGIIYSEALFATGAKPLALGDSVAIACVLGGA